MQNLGPEKKKKPEQTSNVKRAKVEDNNQNNNNDSAVFRTDHPQLQKQIEIFVQHLQQDQVPQFYSILFQVQKMFGAPNNLNNNTELSKQQKTSSADLTKKANTSFVDYPNAELIAYFSGISFLGPVRKKCDLQICKDQDHGTVLKLVNKQNTEVQFLIKDTTPWLLTKTPRGDPVCTFFESANSVVFSISGNISFVSEGTSKLLKSQEVLETLQKLLVDVVKPRECIEQVPELTKKLSFVSAHISANEGHLFFFKEGLFWGYKKPVRFCLFSEAIAVDFTSVTSRTFNIQYSSPTQQIEFSMISREFQDIIGHYLAHFYHAVKKTSSGANQENVTEGGGEDSSKFRRRRNTADQQDNRTAISNEDSDEEGEEEESEDDDFELGSSDYSEDEEFNDNSMSVPSEQDEDAEDDYSASDSDPDPQDQAPAQKVTKATRETKQRPVPKNNTVAAKSKKSDAVPTKPKERKKPAKSQSNKGSFTIVAGPEVDKPNKTDEPKETVAHTTQVTVIPQKEETEVERTSERTGATQNQSKKKSQAALRKTGDKKQVQSTLPWKII